MGQTRWVRQGGSDRHRNTEVCQPKRVISEHVQEKNKDRKHSLSTIFLHHHDHKEALFGHHFPVKSASQIGTSLQAAFTATGVIAAWSTITSFFCLLHLLTGYIFLSKKS